MSRGSPSSLAVLSLGGGAFVLAALLVYSKTLNRFRVQAFLRGFSNITGLSALVAMADTRIRAMIRRGSAASIDTGRPPTTTRQVPPESIGTDRLPTTGQVPPEKKIGTDWPSTTTREAPPESIGTDRPPTTTREVPKIIIGTDRLSATTREVPPERSIETDWLLSTTREVPPELQEPTTQVTQECLANRFNGLLMQRPIDYAALVGEHHVASVWALHFAQAATPGRFDRGKLYALRIAIARQTMSYCQSMRYQTWVSSDETSAGTLVTVELDGAAVLRSQRGTRTYQDPEDAQRRLGVPVTVDTDTLALNSDCLECALALKADGYNPVVLNMASASHPGGGWLQGAGAQEENVFRRTTYHLALNRQEVRYPIPLEGCVYTPDVQVFRASEAKGYALLPAPICLAFIACAAISRPQLADARTLAPQPLQFLTTKITTLCMAALAQGHDSIVLSALGCGAYRNPPDHVASIFKSVLESPALRNRFRVVRFAIFDDHNCYNRHNPRGNLLPFQDVFNVDVQ